MRSVKRAEALINSAPLQIKMSWECINSASEMGHSKCKLSSIRCPPAQFIQPNKCTFPVWISVHLWHYTLSWPSETWLQTGASWRGSSWLPHRAQMSISINHTPAWTRHKQRSDWPCLIWSNSKPARAMTARRLKQNNIACLPRRFRLGAHLSSPWGHSTAAVKITSEIITKTGWP